MPGAFVGSGEGHASAGASPNSGQRSPRVLYLTYDGLLEPLGRSQVLSYLKRLAARGISLTVLSFEKGTDLDDEARVHALAATLEERGIAWSRRRYHASPALPATAWDIAVGRRFASRWLRTSPSRSRLPVVHARSYIAGLMAAGVLGGRPSDGDARFLFDMRGFWVDERIQGGYWSPGSLPVRLGRWAERRLLSTADHLVLLTERARARLPALAPDRRVPPATVIPTCVDTERFRPAAEPGPIRRSLGLPDVPILVHVGTLTGWYDGAATLAVAGAWVRRTGGLFVVLTRDVAAARTLARSADVEARVHTVDHDDVPLWLQASSAGLALVRPSPAKDGSFPTKIGEYLASGLPVLATPVGDVPDLETPWVLRTVAPGFDTEEAASWLVDSVRREPAAAARALAERHLDLDAGVASLVDLYHRLGAEPVP